jgi:hypothetical protein
LFDARAASGAAEAILDRVLETLVAGPHIDPGGRKPFENSNHIPSETKNAITPSNNSRIAATAATTQRPFK